MGRFCSQCGTPRADGISKCPRCTLQALGLGPLASLLGWIMRMLIGCGVLIGRRLRRPMRRTQRFHKIDSHPILDRPQSGMWDAIIAGCGAHASFDVRTEYRLFDDLPQEVQALMDQARLKGDMTFTVSDSSSGSAQEFDSWADVPDDIQALWERIRKVTANNDDVHVVCEPHFKQSKVEVKVIRPEK